MTVIFKFAIPAHVCLSRTGFFATVMSHLASDIIMHASCTEFVSSNTTIYLNRIHFSLISIHFGICSSLLC